MKIKARHPYLTYIRRAFCLPRLRQLTPFSRKFANLLFDTNGGTVNFQIQHPLLKYDLPKIVRALGKKSIKQITFSWKIESNLSVNKTKLISLLAKAIRGTIRDLATYGIPKTEKTRLFSGKDKKDDIEIKTKIILKPGNKADVEIRLETNFFMNGDAGRSPWR